MKSPPNIAVQLVHIYGALKGEIQEFCESEIFIGRDPSSHVLFPKDLAFISRKHAEIVREGNRFKLTNMGVNGTFVNGERLDKAEETYLKDGDVLTFGEGGPKASFLTKMIEAQVQKEKALTSERPEVPVEEEKPPVPNRQPEPKEIENISVQKVQAPLIIQYGPTLRSYRELPITIGKKQGSDFALDHPSILDRHAQVFFSRDQYWVKDITGQKLLSINGFPINLQAPLEPNDVLALSPGGPSFSFLGGGRLAEIEKQSEEQPVHDSKEKEEISKEKGSTFNIPKEAGSILKKFLKR